MKTHPDCDRCGQNPAFPNGRGTNLCIACEPFPNPPGVPQSPASPPPEARPGAKSFEGWMGGNYRAFRDDKWLMVYGSDVWEAALASRKELDEAVEHVMRVCESNGLCEPEVATFRAAQEKLK